MRRIESNGWFVVDSSIEKSLMRFFVSINPMIVHEKLMFKLTVIDSNIKERSFIFHSLEETIIFTEDIIEKCENIDEVSLCYCNDNHINNLTLNKTM